MCYGGEKDESDDLNPMENCLCYDASKSDKSVIINPWNKRHMDAIGYYKRLYLYRRKAEKLGRMENRRKTNS